MKEDSTKARGETLSNVIRIDDDRIQDHLKHVVRGSVEDTLNALLDAKAEWRKLQDLFPSLLDGKSLIVRTTEVVDQGTFYRVMAGPIADFGEAEDLCAQFEASDQYCVVRRLDAGTSQ